MEGAGARRSRLTAKLAGGATMFAISSRSEFGQVGVRNVEACKKCLSELHIPVLSESTGENYGRTVIFFPENGEYHIKAVGREVIVI